MSQTEVKLLTGSPRSEGLERRGSLPSAAKVGELEIGELRAALSPSEERRSAVEDRCGVELSVSSGQDLRLVAPCSFSARLAGFGLPSSAAGNLGILPLIGRSGAVGVPPPTTTAGSLRAFGNGGGHGDISSCSTRRVRGKWRVAAAMAAAGIDSVCVALALEELRGDRDRPLRRRGDLEPAPGERLSDRAPGKSNICCTSSSAC
mmetsp:Transcript_63753/g.101030  ORF Transcript_63753/g.101030 Transcript_63753/m.101030 type:complete len:205 (+) Transcript_63753:427-1041(+)